MNRTLTQNEWMVLTAIQETRDAPQPYTGVELARKCGIGHNTLYLHVTRLEALGLVERPGDYASLRVVPGVRVEWLP